VPLTKTVIAVALAAVLPLACSGSSESAADGGGNDAEAGAAGTQGAAGRGGAPGTAGTIGAAGTTGAAGAQGGAGRGGTTGAAGKGGTTGTAGTGAGGKGGTSGAAGKGGTTGAAGTSGAAGAGAMPAGWLYTSGNKVYVSDGHGGGAVWVGRGVNIDDIFFCGYGATLWMSSPDQTILQMVSGLMSAWKPTFVRVSLSMDSFQPTTSWLSNAAQYKTPMTNIINGIGGYAGVYVLVTLRSDASMIGQDTIHGDPEATGIPSDSTSTPDHTAFPTGTDATYVALVDTFANARYVVFGLTNEPGGNQLGNGTIVAAMTHAVGVIRAEEDRLGVPHHVVSVQGQNWTSDISFYATTPIAHDNVVYEIHGYPPSASMYTYANIPVIIGEYGSVPSGSAAALFADLEAKQIPNLAWDFDPFNDCQPDLLDLTYDATMLTPSAWGAIVQPYLLAHAP
jgi:hypothetical protein